MSDPQASPSEGADLSQGALSTQELRKQNMGLTAHAHQIAQQKTIANTALCFSFVMFCAAMVFGGVFAYQIACGYGEKIHWHASILVAAFVVPPTVIVVALLRGAYSAKQDKESESGPALAFLKEVVGIIKQAWPGKVPH